VAKSALVTGGGTGIGKAVAAALIDAGYSVTIAGRREAVLEASANELKASHPGAVVFTQAVDVGTTTGPGEAVRRHVERAGGIDALVTAAAAYDPKHFCDLDAASWDETMNVALRGSVLAAVEAARYMREHGGGRIVLFSSINAPRSEPESAHYSAAKAAIVSVAKSIAVDLANTNVIANAVAPGWVYTDMTNEFVDRSTPEQLRRVNPLGRVGRVDEIASLVLYLVRDAPEFLSGTTIYADGGQTAAAPLP
jgi:NAD(P)-dependent dehydrogenase (short-subunit alcohol dehydrogenase family)